MPSRRVALAAVGIGSLVGVLAASAFLRLARDEGTQARGDLIAYSCAEPDNRWFAVCVVRTDGTERRQLTHGLWTSDPAWSPDGRRIVFTRHRSAGERVSFEYDELFVVDADGDGLRQLTDNRNGLTLGEPAWSPDGRSIAFVRGKVLPGAGVTFGAIHVMSDDGSDVRRVSSGPLDTAPSWSPDATEIAFTRATGYGSFANADVYLVSATGGRTRRLTRTGDRLETEPAWSPDGSRIVFESATPRTPFDGRAALQVMNRDGSGVQELAAHRLFSRNPGNLAWSPDGRRIAFEISTQSGCTAIAVADVAGGVRQLTSCADGRGASSPDWQPAVG